MTTFPLSLNAIESLATLFHATPAKRFAREVSPVLTGISLTVTPAGWTARATDRFSAAEISAPLGNVAHTIPPEGIELLLDSDDVVALAKAAKPRTVRPRRAVALFDLTVSTEDPEARPAVAVTMFGEPVGSVRQLKGNFPPVERLFPKEEGVAPTEFALDPVKLARLHKVLTPSLAGSTPASREAMPLKATVSPGEGIRPLELTRFPRTLAEGETFRALLMQNKEI